MNLDKILSRYAASPTNRAELRRLARALGTELTHARLDVLRVLRKQLALIIPRMEEHERCDPCAYASGYVKGMLDLTAAYEVRHQENENTRDLEELALRQEYNEVLVLLRQRPMLASELHAAFQDSRSDVTRVLQTLCMLGWVHARDDHFMNDHRTLYALTSQARRILARVESMALGDLTRGISLAVDLFSRVLTSQSDPASILDTMASEVITALAATPDDRTPHIDKLASLVIEAIASRDHEHGQLHPAPSHGEVLWQSAPHLLKKLERRASRRAPGEEVPIYVRTNDARWGAWAFALGQGHATGQSRTIVDGDIVSRSIQPPEQRFHLLYDHPLVITADSRNLTMQAFMERAEEKFVVTDPDDDRAHIPEDFIPLSYYEPEEPAEITAT